MPSQEKQIPVSNHVVDLQVGRVDALVRRPGSPARRPEINQAGCRRRPFVQAWLKFMGKNLAVEHHANYAFAPNPVVLSRATNTNMPTSGKPNPVGGSPEPIKRRTFPGIGLSGFAGLSLPGRFQLRAQTTTEKPKSKSLVEIKTTSETSYWDRTDRFEEKLKLLEAAWQRKDFRLARALAHSLRNSYSAGGKHLNPCWLRTEELASSHRRPPKRCRTQSRHNAA